MAKSGYIRKWFTDWDYVQFDWEVTSQSVANNTSTVAWRLSLHATDDGRIDSSAKKACTVTVNGQTFTGSVYINVRNNDSMDLMDDTIVIAHNSNGTKTFNFSFNLTLGITFDGAYLANTSGSGSGTLDSIARASTLKVSNGTLGTAQTLTITRQDSSFKHRIAYNCGGVEGYVAGSASTFTTSTSISWTPPLSLASQNTTGTTVKVSIGLYTYTNTGTLIGLQAYTVYYTIPASVKPTATFKLEDIKNIDDIYGSPVQGLSRIKITVTATPSYGSAVQSCKITADGSTYNTTEATTGTLKTAGNSPVTATVTDARGRSGSVSYTMNVKAYDRPNVSELTVHRCDQNGNEDDQGDYIRAVFSATVTNIGGLNKNAAAYKLRYKQTTAEDYTEITFSDLAGKYAVTNRAYIFAADSGSSYDVEIVAQDSHATTTRSTSASTAFTLMNWGADGTSVGIGKVAEQANTLEVALNAEFTGRTVQKGNRYAFSTAGEAGVSGYILMARIAITAANADTPITFVFSQRRALTTMTVHVQLNNSTATASSLGSIRYEGTNYGAFLVKAGELIWDLYVQKDSSYDTITLQDWYTSRTMEARVKVTFPGTLVDSLPADWYRATPAALDSLRDYIYPVGSVYISYSHVSPATLFGGTWVRIENAFLWGVDSLGSIGLTGGEKTHTLTVNELPAHNHGATYTHTGLTADEKKYAWYTTSGSAVGYASPPAGGGQAHNNMPPYVQVSIWRRTA